MKLVFAMTICLGKPTEPLITNFIIRRHPSKWWFFIYFRIDPKMSTGNSKFIGSAAQFRLIQQTTILSPTQMSNIHISEEKNVMSLVAIKWIYQKILLQLTIYHLFEDQGGQSCSMATHEHKKLSNSCVRKEILMSEITNI